MNRHTKRIFKTDNDGLVHKCESTKDTGILIKRQSKDFEQKKAQAIEIASYLAKVKGKDLTPKYTHKFTYTKDKDKKTSNQEQDANKK